MKSTTYLLLGSLLLLCQISFAQQRYVSDDPAYKENVLCAQAAFEAKDYETCASCYEAAMKVSQKSALSLVRTAQCLALNQQAEEAFPYLFSSLNVDWEITERVLDEPGFEVLKEHPQWSGFADSLAHHRAQYEASLNMPLKHELDSILELDQRYRQMMDSVSKEFGWQSPEMGALWAKQNVVDSTNTIRVVEILETHGYPGVSMVGGQSASVAFLVIQHADLELQEKYLPMMKVAADAGEVAWSSIALLVDRVRMRQGKTQLYGSQVSQDSTGKPSFHPIEDPANVNERRAAVGLGPIEEYARYFGFEYVPPKGK